MVDLGGYVIILVETKEKKIKLYGSPADKADLEVGDEILEVNGKCLEDASHTEVISHIHQCIRSRTICLRVKRRTGNRLALDLAQNSNVQDAFVIAVEQQARERLERLSALKRIKPVDMTKLSQQLNQQIPATEHQQELNGFIESSPIYVTSIPPEYSSTNINRRPVLRTGKVPVALSNGHAITNTSSTEEPDSAEIELKQDLNVQDQIQRHSDSVLASALVDSTVKKPDSALVTNKRPSECTVTKFVDSGLTNKTGVEYALTNQCVASVASSGKSAIVADGSADSATSARKHYVNGRTEVLIGQDAQDVLRTTTAIVESNNNRTLVVGDIRPRRRSGSSIVVVDEDPVKHRTPEEQDEEDAYNMMMMTLDNGPHREMAVDVPDSFIARSKTPPRYPPPRPISRTPQGVNGSAKPVPPPRDHLRIEKDGRLVNRAQAPEVPARPSPSLTNNNQDPTKEQLDSIRKFQEALRKRKEDEDRVAQQTEFLNRSLRGSRKLQALESHPPPTPRTGMVNDGYSSTEDIATAVDDDALSTLISYGELVACLQRLQHQLKKSYSSLEGQVLAVQTLLLSPEFGRALAVHNKLQEVLSLPRHSPTCTTGQTLVRDCLEDLQPCSLPEAAELADLLTRYELEGLIYAHDAIGTQHLALHVTDTPPEETLSDQFLAEDNIKIIKIEKTNEPLGATVRNEGDAVMIGRIVRGGAAEKSGLLHEGDEVLEVNGIEMRGKSVNDVCDLLGAMTGTLTFIIVPQTGQQPQQTTIRDNLMHMKAHFDYDPEEDLYIPCRELGISFQKGDVLHVISQDDANWWQAFREGEEDQTLAGLIPSRSFQHQRESLKQSIGGGDKTAREKVNKKTNTLLCAKKNTKKKKKSKLGSSAVYSDGSYPIYATTIETEYEVEEILTYEEVSLYYPRANHKRPIVLIGPPNIGRHELRQRLMEDAERFAAAIPHTSRSRKDGEIDGQDYHFISRVQFEADILSRRFVEHGEYEKAYYGTSLEAIRSVVSSGKICVLNLHPQSLRILRSSDLKPYVVFVAPPSLEKLRQKKIRSGEAYKEDELKDIIEKAREMEDKYGHYFDMIIINNETERAYHQLLTEINSLEREPQWVPAAWLKTT